MADIYGFRQRIQCEQEASVWLAKLHGDAVSQSDRAAFERWYQQSPQHARAYNEMLATWRELESWGGLARAVDMGQRLMVSPKQARPWRRWSALAATLAALGAGLVWYGISRSGDTYFQTAIGERATVALQDGSSLQLNSNSRVRVHYEPSKRIVYLDRGEAFFQVAHAPQRPFWVVADGHSVVAVGTAFNVFIKPSGLEVTVSEGTVRVSATLPDADTGATTSSEPISILTAGERVDVHGRSSEIHALPTPELRRSIAWRQGNVYLNDQALLAAVEEMNRYTSVPIEIEDSELRNLKIGGTFDADEAGVDAFLQTLHDGLGLTVQRDPDGHVYITRPAAKNP